MFSFKEFCEDYKRMEWKEKNNKEDEISYTNYFSKRPDIFHVTHNSKRLGDDRGYNEKEAREEAMRRYKAVPGRTFRPKW